MSNPTYPIVAPNQRLNPLDFNRMSDRIEDALAQVIGKLFLDTSSAAYLGGVVIRGFEINQTGLPVNEIRVTKGLAIVPNGAPPDPDRDDASSGNNAAWRLVETTSDTILVLHTLPAVGTRDDAIGITRGYATSLTESREIRTEGTPDTSAPAIKDTMRSVTGTAAQVVGTVLGAGIVRVATIEVDINGFLTYTDLRTMLLPVDVDSPINRASVGFQAHTHSIREAISDLFSRVPKAIHPDGLAQAIITADGNDNILVDGAGEWLSATVINQMQLDTQARHIRTSAMMHATRFRMRDIEDQDCFTPDNVERNITVHGADICRAKVIVRIEKAAAGGAVTAIRYIGYGVTEVKSIGFDYLHRITFPGNLFLGPNNIGGIGGGGDLSTNGFGTRCCWYVKVTPHHDCPGYDGVGEEARHTRTYVVQHEGPNRIYVYGVTTPIAGSPAYQATSYVLELFGPLGVGVTGPGDTPDGWDTGII